MKKLFYILGILVLIFFVSGAGCKDIDDAVEDVMKDKDTEFDVMDSLGDEGEVLVERTRYAQAGDPPFDFTNVIFSQKEGKGYKIEVNTDNNVEVEIMTDKDCLLRGQGDDYDIISSDSGTAVIILGEKNTGEDRNICVGAIATGDGQTEVEFKVTELV